MSTSDFMAPSIKSAKSGKGNAKSGIELGGVRKASGSSRRDEGIGNNAAQQDPHRKLSQLMLDRMHLEMENNEMEQRLEQLRFSMQKEREERQSAGGYRWKSGQTGNLTYPNQGSLQDKENSVKASPGRMKLKILKDPGPVKQPVVPKLSYSAVVENTRFKGKACGQCDDRNAMLTCLECAEDYCVSCFTKFHHKGGLKFHRTAPFQGRYAPVPKLDVPKLDIAEQVKKEIERDLKKLDAKLDSTKEMRSHSLPNNPSPETGKSFSAESVSTSSTFPVDEKPSGGALLQGTFNEAESSDSFKEILTDWRNSKSDYKTKHKVHEVNPESVGESEVQTLVTTGNKALDIDFTQNGLNYMERLMLKKHRRTPLDQLPSVQIGDIRHTGTFLDSSRHRLDKEDQGLTAEEMEDHEQYAALFRTLPTEVTPERAPSSLKFVELNEASEEDLEESSNFVVQEVDSELHFTEQSIPADKHETNHLSVREKSDLSQVCNEEKKAASGTGRDSHSRPLAGKKKAAHRGPRATPDGGPGAALDCGDRISTTKRSAALGKRSRARAGALPTAAPRAVTAAVSSSPRSLSANEQIVAPNRAQTSQSPAGSAAGDWYTQVEDLRVQGRTAVSKYRGMDGFLVLGVDPKEVQKSCAPRRSDSSQVYSWSLHAGGGQWRPASSLGEYADDVFVQTVVEDALARPASSRLGQLTLCPKVEQVTLTPRSSKGYRSQRSLSATTPRLIGSKATRPTSAASRPLSRAATEILEIVSVDFTEQEDPLEEDDTELQALNRLEKEFIDLKNDLKCSFPARGQLNSATTGTSNNSRDPQSYLHNLPDQELHLTKKSGKSDSRRRATTADLANSFSKEATEQERCLLSSVNFEDECQIDDADDDEEQSRQDKENVMSLC